MKADWWQKFRAQRRVRFIWKMLLALIIISVLADLISNDRPIRCSYHGKVYYPLFQPGSMVEMKPQGGEPYLLKAAQAPWSTMDLSASLWPIVPYGTTARINHRNISPFGEQRTRDGKILGPRFRHWLGTDQAGNDLLALMLRGGRISVGIGLLAMLLAGSIGFLIGSFAGYFGDDRLLLPRFMGWTLISALLLGIWYGFVRRSVLFEDSEGLAWWGHFLGGMLWVAGVTALILTFFFLIWRRGKQTKKAIKIDFVLSRVIEVLDSLPQLLLIITMGAILSRDIWTFVALVGLTGWSGVARLVRGESLRLRNADYITAARISGLPSHRILFRQVWPQVLPPLLVPLAFGIGSVIVAESALSFLNIIENSHSWGAMLSSSLQNRDLWWLPVFPGLAIFFTVLAVNVLGESLRKAIAPAGTN